MSTTSSNPVVLLSIDTLRLDRFTETCFPESMPIFEEDFANFTNAYSHGTATPFAFPGIITGQPTVGDGHFADGSTTIAELFDGPAIGFSNNAHLHSGREYDRGFDAFNDQHPPDWSPSGLARLKSIDRLRESQVVTTAYRAAKKAASLRGDGSSGLSKQRWSADRITDFVQRQLEEDNTFVWGHYMDSHKPFTPVSGVDVPDIDRTDEEIEWLNSYEHEKEPLGHDDMAAIEKLYDSNVRYVDRELARLLRDLRTKAWYDDALVIVVGDHGELFGEHGCMWHPGDIDPPDELIETPLLVKYPERAHAGTTFDHLVQHGDIIATIAGTIDAERDHFPENVHPLTDTAARHVVSKTNTAVRVIESDATAIRRRDGTVEGVETISPAGREALDSATFPAVSTLSGKVKGVTNVTDVQRSEQLKALGYR